ncbi:hypothetical protein [Nonomuraea sediminis]|uniref:hypothetical protein n=1 Tax=Nonomuraea sediminis TaxID=2835864 RepID=UPI001BDC2419|nr:hypothetical protein [Nonomuraea sediminis]
MKRILALAVTAVALTGCGLLPAQQGGGGEEKQQTAAVPPSVPPAQATATSPVLQDSPAKQSDKAIASREVKVTAGGNSGTAKVDITLLQRQGKLVSLNISVTALDGKVSLHGQMGNDPGDLTLGRVSLIDTVNGKRYRVARNGTGADAACICSTTQGVWPEKGQTASLYAVFGAPPPDVTKVNIEMPPFGVFTDVPLS